MKFCPILFLAALSCGAQPRPYIGYVYPAGGQQGTTIQVRVGGQNVSDVASVLITGQGVTGRVSENYRRLDFQEMQLLNEQLRVLRKETMSPASQAMAMMADDPNMMSEMMTNHPPSAAAADNSVEAKKDAARKLIDRIEKRTAQFVPVPASESIASLILLDITIAADAEPGEREIRLVTLRGVSDPLVFYVGQLPELSRKPMLTATKQVLGKESSALRQRPASEVEDRISLPCTLNGQIASGEMNRYRFEARRGQHLLITTLGRQLVPFIADAVPGWLQPVLTLYDAAGKEVAYDDDYRFKPDPTLLYEVPKDGEYVLAIRDSLYRGREDFVYRITVGELPFITSIFPLGGHAGGSTIPQAKGWNLDGSQLSLPPADAGPGTYTLASNRKGTLSNRVPFALDSLPEIFEREPNNTVDTAQKITLPIIINGRIDKPGDWDVFQFSGRSNQIIVAEVTARRLDSPLDSIVKLTDNAGNLLALNDDHEDFAAGLNTHLADSYFMAQLPADGTYFVHIGDTARQGGEEYGYRLRLSEPLPDFELRIVPSSLSMRSKSSGSLTIYAQRKDGFNGPIKLSLKDPLAGFTATPVTLSPTQTMARLNIKTDLVATKDPVTLSVVGQAKIGDQELTHEAVPAEDRMQAFLWRHLVPAKDLRVLVYDPNYQAPPTRNPPPPLPHIAATNATPAANYIVSTNGLTGTNLALASSNSVPAKPKFTKQQVAYRLRQLRQLFEEGMLTDEFYNEKVDECESAE